MAPYRAAGTRSVWSLIPRITLALVLSAGLTVCGGDSSSGPDPVDNTVTSVSVSPTSGTLDAIGSTTTFSAVGRNSAGSTVAGTTFTWSSSNGTVAAVSDAGVATAIGNGTATITATATGTSASGTAQVTVQQAVASVSVSPQDGSIEIGETVQLTATAEDSGGATVEGASFTWASSDVAVATVSTAGLVTGVADGNVTITATSGGSNGTAPVNVIRNDLEITNDQNLEGDITADEFSIPAGVTVTATGDLTIDATGEIQILGTIIGDCVGLTIQGDTAVTVGGTLDNTCAAGGVGDSIVVVADGELTLENATIISSGDMEFSNDPTLTDNDFPEAGASQVSYRSAAGSGPQRAGKGIPFTVVNNSTVQYEGGVAGPNDAEDGADNDNGDGGDGKDGRRVRFRLRGNAEFNGGTGLYGQNAGNGGYGNKEGTTDVEAEGGDGGDGGDIRVWVTGTLTYAGSDNVVRSGRGGHGGNSDVEGLENPDPPKAPSATAEGGKGGEPGLIDIRAGGGVTVGAIVNSSLTLEIGNPGDGGDATATGADGVDATDTKPAQHGGDATATGGEAGSTPDKRLVANGNVTGADPDIEGHDGGDLVAGEGGFASASAGDGGTGVKANKDGGDGGANTANGGMGGSYELKFRGNDPFGMGGNGGFAGFSFGQGGDGWDDCEPGQPEEDGGAGGKGGNATGTDGEKGTGTPNGSDGGTFVTFAGNGGDGGREQGAGGDAGTDAIVSKGPKTENGINFVPGDKAEDCPAEPPINTSLQLNQIPNSSGLVDFGSYLVDLVDDAAQAIGQAVIATFGTAGNHFFGSDPDRVGLFSNTNGWDVLLPEFVVGTNQFTPDQVEICLLNTTVDEMNPATLEQIDGEGQVIDTYFWTSLASPDQRPGPSMMSMNNGCVTRQILVNARIIRVRAPAGRFGDFNRFRFSGPPPG